MDDNQDLEHQQQEAPEEPEGGHNTDLAQSLQNNGVTKEELQEVLAGMFGKQEPTDRAVVEAAEKEYFKSFLK